MAAQLDHADSGGLLRDSDAGDSQIMHSGELLGAFRKTHAFRRAGGDVRRVQLWSSARRSLWLGVWCAASLGIRCEEVTQRAVLPEEEESQRETASDTL